MNDPPLRGNFCTWLNRQWRTSDGVIEVKPQAVTTRSGQRIKRQIRCVCCPLIHLFVSNRPSLRADNSLKRTPMPSCYLPRGRVGLA
jgi:hypothetical protein